MTVVELFAFYKTIAKGLNASDKAWLISMAVEDLAAVDRKDAPESLPTPKPKKKKEPNQSKIIVPSGTRCMCDICKTTVYIAVADVYAEGMTGEEFVACFNPEPTLPLDISVGDDGNDRVNCPACRGDKSVVFIKRGK